LHTVRCDLRSLPSEVTEQSSHNHVVIGRGVLQYNSLSDQQQILHNIHDILLPGGTFAYQLNTGGSAEQCRIRSEIMQSPLLWGEREPGDYHWTTEDRYVAMLECAKFIDIRRLGEAPATWISPESIWKRFTVAEYNDVRDIHEQEEALERRRVRFLQYVNSVLKNYLESGSCSTDVRSGSAAIEFQVRYPVYSCKRPHDSLS